MSTVPSTTAPAACSRDWKSLVAAAVAGAAVGAVVVGGLFSSKKSASSRYEGQNAQGRRAEKYKVNLLHRLDRSLQQAALASTPRSPVRRHKTATAPHATHVVRIALTGGPCAGKSSALSQLRQQCTQAGFDVYSAPEVATILFNSGVMFPSTEQGVFTFQLALMKLQLRLERSMTSVAEATGRPSIVVFDRGLFDAKGYMSETTWEHVLQELNSRTDDHLERDGVTEEYLLQRYDGVIHLTTAADGALKYYKWGKTTDDSGNTVIRGESPEAAVRLDQTMRQCWSAHPRHIIISNSEEDGFQGKLNKAVKAVLDIAEESHPTESARAAEPSIIAERTAK